MEVVLYNIGETLASLAYVSVDRNESVLITVDNNFAVKTSIILPKYSRGTGSSFAKRIGISQ